MITVRGPGRCTECSFHVGTQSHRQGCSGTAPIYEEARSLDELPEEMLGLARYFLPEWTDNFLENCRQIKAQRGAEHAHGAGNLKRRVNGVIKSTPTEIAQPGTNPSYVEAAIRAELQRLADAREGTRNHTLHCCLQCVRVR